jgi:hypothetical protein
MSTLQHHDRLGEIEVLLEYEAEGKKIAFVSTYKRPKWNEHTESNEWIRPQRHYTKPLKKQYYALWGKSDDLDTRGITWIRTPKDCDPRNPSKYFFEFLKTVEFINFKK